MEKNMDRDISLRPLTSTDAEAFMTWGGDSSVTQSLFWDAYTDVREARQFLTDVAEKHPWFMAITLNKVPVGALTLDRGKGRADKRAELGYVLAKKYWGQGIATEAVKLALNRGFSDLGIVRVEALVDPENIGSIRVLEKAGMEQEGLLKNYVVHRSRIRDRYLYAKILAK